MGASLDRRRFLAWAATASAATLGACDAAMVDAPAAQAPTRVDSAPNANAPFRGGVTPSELPATPAANLFANVQPVASLRTTLLDGATAEYDHASAALVVRSPDGTERWREPVGPGNELLSLAHATAWGPNLATIDRSAGVVAVFDARGDLVARLPDGEPMLSPSDAIALPSGDLLVVDTPAQTIHRFSTTGRRTDFVRATPDGLGVFNGPGGVAILDGEVLVTDLGEARVLRFSESGETLGQFGSNADGLVRPRGLATDASGRVLVADPVAGRVFQFERGQLVDTWAPDHDGPGWTSPWRLSVSPDGQLSVVTS
jgi:DNA-binding beta-propeller fold protein YncE